MDDILFFARCRELAAAAVAGGNPAVGSVIVRDAVIVGEGQEAGRSKGDVTCHAEIESIRDAAHRLGTTDLSDCVLYTTHEPCVMCAYVIRYHGLREVVYETAVPVVGGVNSIYPVLTDAAFWPTKGVPLVRQVHR